MKPDEKLGIPGFAQSLANTMVSAVVKKCNFRSARGLSKERSKHAPGAHGRRKAKGNPRAGLLFSLLLERLCDGGKAG